MGLKHKNLNKKKGVVLDGYPIVSIDKSYMEGSKSFVTPNYADKRSWFFDATEVDGETAGHLLDYKEYSFASGKDVIDLDQITDREDWLSRGITVYKNSSEVDSSEYTIDYLNNKIVFDSANIITDVITIDYSYANSSKFELVSTAGKKVLLTYVETQFSKNATFNDVLRFELILNNTSTGNQDIVVGKTRYITAKDFLNKGNKGNQLMAFGELTQDVNVFPWDYLTGFTIKPVGDDTTNPMHNEFNKVRVYLENDTPYTNCELATGTFYCKIEDL